MSEQKNAFYKKRTLLALIFLILAALFWNWKSVFYFFENVFVSQLTNIEIICDEELTTAIEGIKCVERPEKFNDAVKIFSRTGKCGDLVKLENTLLSDGPVFYADIKNGKIVSKCHPWRDYGRKSCIPQKWTCNDRKL